MKNLLPKAFDISATFNLKAIANVEELVNYDMIYVYHHLNIGDTLKLIYSEIRLNGDHRYEVYYKNFKLGYISMGGLTKSLYGGYDEIIASISSFSKEKYLPIKSLDIILHPMQLKKVS